MYRKISEKSRAWGLKRINVFLSLGVLILCLILIGTGLLIKSTAGPRRVELVLARQCEDLFGSDFITNLIAEFEEQNPALRISLKAGDDSKGLPSPPDIIFYDEDLFSAPAARDALILLDPYMPAETAAGIRAIPLVSFMDLFFYNITILQAAGFDRPPKTRDEFLACAKAVSGLKTGAGASGVYGSALGLSPEDPRALRRDIFSWIWAAGADLQPPGRDGRPYFSDRSVVEVITFWEQLNREGTLAPGTFVRTGAERIEEFAQGKIAMMIASSQEIPFLRQRMGASAFGITTIPGSSLAGKSSLGISGIYAGISGDCARPDEAWTFLSFLAEKLEKTPADGEDSFYLKAQDIFEASEIVHGFSGDPRGEALEHIVREELRLFFEQDQSPADTVAAIQRRWDSL
ncbi:MAG: extracellular solute-binding protein [Treponema sp.]|jgi:multiple sugar transport system substrate-binding protein|nr:extracellular solute-binding protein [Treponema sp.]